MPVVSLSPPARLQFFDSSGVTLPSAQLYTYLAGTTTPEATFTDYTGAVANANPVIANSRGEVTVWLDRAKAYKYVLKDSNDVTIWTEDQVNYAGPNGISQTFANGSAAAPSVNFTQATTSGLYSPAPNEVAMATNGVLSMRWDASQNVGIGGTPTTKLDVFGTARIQGALTVSVGGANISGGLSVAGGAGISGNSSVAGQLTVTAGAFVSRGFSDLATTASWNIDTSGRLLNNALTQPSFAAYRSTSQQTSGTTLIFNAEQYDHGANYNPSTGVFTAPVAGVYAFSASAEFTNSTGAVVGLQLRISCSSAGEVAAHSAQYANGVTFSASTSVVVKLAAGETVSVTINAALAALFVLTATNYTRFSGHLLG